MTATSEPLEQEQDPKNIAPTTPVIRFLRGPHLLGQIAVNPEQTIVEHAEACGVELPTSCTSGTCGTCTVSVVFGEVALPDELPPGLEAWLAEEGGRLGCMSKPHVDVDIDIMPPI